MLGVMALAGCQTGPREFQAEVTTNCGPDGKVVSEVFDFFKFDCVENCGYVSTGQPTSDEPFPLTVFYRSFAEERGGDNYLIYPADMKDWSGRSDIALDELGTDVTRPALSGDGTCTVRIEELTDDVRD